MKQKTSIKQIKFKTFFGGNKTAKRAGKVEAIFSKFRLVQKLWNGTAQFT
jgi:hypothetical protein